MSPRYPVRPRPAIHRSSLREWREDGDGASIEARGFWRWATAAPDPDYDAKELLLEDEKTLFEEYRAMGKASSGGGALVPTDLSEKVFSAARAASAIAGLAADFPTSAGETLPVPVAATHGSGSWTAESGSYTPSDETITQVNLGAHKATTKIVASEELRTDSAILLDDWLATELGGRLGALIENACTVGDGSGKPLGLVTAGNGISVVTAATGSATAFKLADLKAVYKALPLAYRRTASWLIGGDDFAELAALADSAGAVILPSLQFDPPSLFGRPVEIGADLPAPAASAKSLVFGDFRLGYGIRHITGIGMQRQDELHSDTGQLGYRLYARVDGRPLLTDALRILAHSAS